jgi:hypothetical protein
MTRDESQALVRVLNLDSILHKMMPSTIGALALLLGGSDDASTAVWRICQQEEGTDSGPPSARGLLEHVRRAIPSLGVPDPWPEVLDDLACFEILPYVLLEDEHGRPSTHYSVSTTRVDGGGSAGVASTEWSFRHDVAAIVRKLEAGERPRPAGSPTRLRIAVDRDGAVTVSHHGGRNG